MIYPVDIIDKLVKADKDIIGSVYYKRSEPFDPVVYKDIGDLSKPYKPIDTHDEPRIPLEVSGIGYGGMMVKREVYEKLGEDKWSSYGANFHIPTATTDKESHDLKFCQTAKKYGFKIWVHNGCNAYHIGVLPIGYKDFRRCHPKDERTEIAVVMPCIDEEMGKKTMAQLKEKAGMEADYVLLMDDKRNGFVAVVNDYVKNSDYKYYVYVAQDAYSGKNWLKIAYDELENTGKGLFAFNDGKWHGNIASFGMVRAKWKKPFFFEGYHSHFADTELSEIAKKEDQLVYNSSAVLIEIDYNKKEPLKIDKDLFKQRNPDADYE
jgi:hypothetical protein